MIDLNHRAIVFLRSKKRQFRTFYKSTFLRMNLKKHENNQNVILSRICKDILVFWALNPIFINFEIDLQHHVAFTIVSSI
ncbi:hypothetical protein BpHYR1_042447 [Brachionus plicatilis]|uniref:Uncharacterized protein n=1 Tax=Brachionus plicatilis TaxID=10195 RepID=A0A3M7QWT2_BRAPC|nr:hypothetical protein BpHYR1_042447 [Brachionus plicatilis]